MTKNRVRQQRNSVLFTNASFSRSFGCLRFGMEVIIVINYAEIAARISSSYVSGKVLVARYTYIHRGGKHACT